MHYTNQLQFSHMGELSQRLFNVSFIFFRSDLWMKNEERNIALKKHYDRFNINYELEIKKLKMHLFIIMMS